MAKNRNEGVKMLRQSTTAVTLAALIGTYTMEEFERMFPESWKSCHRCFINGRIFMYELPSHSRDVAANQIFGQLCHQSRFINSDGQGDLIYSGNVSAKLQPDQQIYVDNEDMVRPGAKDGRGIVQLPKVVIEVSRSQSYCGIFSRVPIYFSQGGGDGVRAVIIIIIRRATTGDLAGQLQLVAVYYEHDSPMACAAISFGDYLHPRTKGAIEGWGHIPEGMMQGVDVPGSNLPPTCTAVTRQQYQLLIPTASVLFYGYTEEQMAAMHVETENFHIDLYTIQRHIRSKGEA